MKKRKKKQTETEIYLKACRKANREIELERNGYRWIAIDRPHKNQKKYNRKRDRRIDIDCLFIV